MKKLLLVSALALGLAACGGEDQDAAEDMAADDAMGAAEDQAADMMADAEEMMDEGPSYADMQTAFLAEYALGEGTVVTDSGLMYRIDREGEGASPDANDIVEVHYEGRLVDGTVFDSSYERDETIEFPLNRLIPGWIEGVQYMQEGAKYQFVIPPHLGYGNRTDLEDIPPGSVLVFDLELFKVTPVE